MLYARTSGVTEARKFIHDLKVALKNATEHGGGYSAFLHTPDGKTAVLQVEIAPLIREKK